MFILNVSVVVLATWLITHWIKSATSAKIREQLEKEYQEKHENLENEYAAKMKALEQRERKVAQHEYEEKSFASRWQQLIDRERDVERREQLLAEAVDNKFAQRERELARRERDLEEIIARRVEEGIKGREIGLNDCWRIIKRKFRVVYNRERDMYKRAVLIADHLGVPLKCILKRREKKLVGKITNGLPEERYALIDLVMSCPDDQVKALLAEMQRFPQSSQR